MERAAQRNAFVLRLAPIFSSQGDGKSIFEGLKQAVFDRDELSQRRGLGEDLDGCVICDRQPFPFPAKCGLPDKDI